MKLDQILYLSALGTEFGSHTCSHVNLVDIDIVDQKTEIIDSYKTLNSRLKFKEILFSYPYGMLDSELINIVNAAGYSGSVTNYQGNIRPRTNKWLIPRFTIFSTSNWSTILKQSKSLWLTDIIRDLRDVIILSIKKSKAMVFNTFSDLANNGKISAK